MQLLKLRGLTFVPREILDALPGRNCHSVFLVFHSCLQQLVFRFRPT